MLSLLLMASMATGPNLSEKPWREGLDWHGVHVSMQREPNDGYLLQWPTGKRVIPTPPFEAATASPLFDGLYAMAQDDLKRDSVGAIRDGAFDHGQPIPCLCFETGEKWPYVWTRDLSYAIDLGLWRFDPARSRNGLDFKLSGVRVPSAPQGLYVMQDTGSGGSWPISTDRIVWFLGARHLLDDAGFAARVRQALDDTLAQDRRYAFDPALGLYRGETSFLDWREQTYPAWTADDVVFIAQSFALSTNVLHYQALELAADLAGRHGDRHATDYRAQATALKAAINAHFWRADRGLYMSYLGGDGLPVEAYDLLGLSLAITSGVADPARARQALANYPTWASGSPVIWPERADQPIYHNRAIWPFVSAYALRAARAVDDPARIAHEIRSVVRGAALAGSNMENYELLTQGIHLDDGALSGPVVNSPRQLWSVAGFLDIAIEGVFGLTADGRVEPKLPVSLVPTLFGDADHIDLQLRDRRITLRRPPALDGNLLVAASSRQEPDHTVVMLKAINVPEQPLRTDTPLYAPATPAAPTVQADGDHWRVRSPGKGVLYVNGRRHGAIDGSATLARSDSLQCIRVTQVDDHGIESLPSPEACVGDRAKVAGAWPRHWTAPASGRYRAMLDYANTQGPINTGITAAVKWLVVDCGDGSVQRLPLVMPHSVRQQHSTWADFTAKAGARCHFSLEDGFNMSYLRHNAHYTGGAGGDAGALNHADVGDLLIAPL
ncbi:Six-hairpin glycosidase-like protein [Frateuria sp. GZRR33]|uniref:Six-hairpin glycosidase-like protein n=1 Tax=Frateuria sp. GZRR33 TaxID=3351535 RepID=UPI003EDC0A65